MGGSVRDWDASALLVFLVLSLFNSSIRGAFVFSLHLGLGWSELQILGVCRAALILILPFSTGPATNCPSQSAIINTSLLNRPIQILFLSTGQDINCLVNQQPLQILGLGRILVLPFSTAPRYLYCPCQPPFDTCTALLNRPSYLYCPCQPPQIQIGLGWAESDINCSFQPPLIQILFGLGWGPSSTYLVLANHPSILILLLSTSPSINCPYQTAKILILSLPNSQDTHIILLD